MTYYDPQKLFFKLKLLKTTYFENSWFFPLNVNSSWDCVVSLKQKIYFSIIKKRQNQHVFAQDKTLEFEITTREASVQLDESFSSSFRLDQAGFFSASSNSNTFCESLATALKKGLMKFVECFIFQWAPVACKKNFLLVSFIKNKQH